MKTIRTTFLSAIIAVTYSLSPATATAGDKSLADVVAPITKAAKLFVKLAEGNASGADLVNQESDVGSLQNGRGASTELNTLRSHGAKSGVRMVNQTMSAGQIDNHGTFRANAISHNNSASGVVMHNQNAQFGSVHIAEGGEVKVNEISYD